MIELPVNKPTRRRPLLAKSKSDTGRADSVVTPSLMCP